VKVILIEEVKKQGKKGDVIEVKDGYGNFLINNKQAVLASSLNLDKLKKENEQKEKEFNNDVKEAEKTKEKLEKITLTFVVKTGKEDKVFGSISQKQISEKLKEQGFEIDKKQIKVSNQIAALGGHDVEIELHKKVNAAIKVFLTAGGGNNE